MSVFFMHLLSLFFRCVTIESDMAVRRRKTHDVPVSWLPVDSRLFLPILSFSHVKGLARLFLEIEIVLSLLVVIGTLALLAIRMLR